MISVMITKLQSTTIRHGTVHILTINIYRSKLSVAERGRLKSQIKPRNFEKYIQ